MLLFHRSLHASIRLTIKSEIAFTLAEKFHFKIKESLAKLETQIQNSTLYCFSDHLNQIIYLSYFCLIDTMAAQNAFV